VWLLIAQGCVSTVSLWCTRSSNGCVDTERDSYGILAAAFRYWSSIDSVISWGRVAWAAAAYKGLVFEWWTLCVCWPPLIQRIQGGRKYAWNGAKWIIQGWCEVGIRGSAACPELDHIVILSGGLSKWPLNRISMWCSIWDYQPWQESGSEVCLNSIPERGNTWLHSLGKPGIHEPCLRTRYINLISRRQFFYPWMIRHILCWIWLRKVKKSKVILICHWLWIIQHCWFSEYPELFRNFIVLGAWNRLVKYNSNHTRRFWRTWKLQSHFLIWFSLFHTDNIW